MPQQNCCCPCLIHEQTLWLNPPDDPMWQVGDTTQPRGSRSPGWYGVGEYTEVSEYCCREDNGDPRYVTNRYYPSVGCDDSSAGVRWLKKPIPSARRFTHATVELDIYNGGSATVAVSHQSSAGKIGYAARILPINNECTSGNSCWACQIGEWSGGSFAVSRWFFIKKSSLPALWNVVPEEVATFVLQIGVYSNEVVVSVRSSSSPILIGETADSLPVNLGDGDSLGNYVAISNSGDSQVNFSSVVWLLDSDARSDCPSPSRCWYCDSFGRFPLGKTLSCTMEWLDLDLGTPNFVCSDYPIEFQLRYLPLQNMFSVTDECRLTMDKVFDYDEESYRCAPDCRLFGRDIELSARIRIQCEAPEEGYSDESVSKFVLYWDAEDNGATWQQSAHPIVAQSSCDPLMLVYEIENVRVPCLADDYWKDGSGSVPCNTCGTFLATIRFTITEAA